MPDRIRLTFLGTGDSVPSSERNHTAILLTYRDENILVDCGEGTQRQFKKAGISVSKITKILITHLHGDHTLGISGVLQTMASNERKEPVYIYGPEGIKEFMKSLLRLFPFSRNFEINVEEAKGKFLENEDFFIEAEKMTHLIPCNAYAFVKKGKIRIDKSALKKEKIKEGPWLKELKEGKDLLYEGKKYPAKKLTYEEDNKKISFVLDTSLNSKIVPFVKNSDILVCEATFAEDMEEKARQYKHLTSAQAAKAAKESGSKRLILTHISQRYEKDTKTILGEAKKAFKDSLLAEDLKVFEL